MVPCFILRSAKRLSSVLLRGGGGGGGGAWSRLWFLDCSSPIFCFLGGGGGGGGAARVSPSCANTESFKTDAFIFPLCISLRVSPMWDIFVLGGGGALAAPAPSMKSFHGCECPLGGGGLPGPWQPPCVWR